MTQQETIEYARRNGWDEEKIRALESLTPEEYQERMDRANGLSFVPWESWYAEDVRAGRQEANPLSDRKLVWDGITSENAEWRALGEEAFNRLSSSAQGREIIAGLEAKLERDTARWKK